MTQSTAPAASPAGAPPPRPARRVWPRVLIALGIVLVLAIGAAAAYLATIDRSVTSNLTRGVDLPTDDPSAPPGDRERKQLPDGDLDRAKNQRNVLKAIVAKGLSGNVVADPAKFNRFMAGVAKHLTVDNNLTDDEIRRTALSLRLDTKEIALLQAPISGFGTTPDGQSIDLVDTARMAELARALKTDTMDGYVEKYPQG